MNALLLVIVIVLALAVVGVGLFFFRRQNVAVKTPPRTAVAAPDVPSGALVQDEPEVEPEPQVQPEPEAEPEVESEPEPVEKATFRDRLAGVLGGLRGRSIDEEAWEELEEALILADVGVPTTMAILDRVRDRAKEEKAKDFDAALMLLRRDGARIGRYGHHPGY